VIAGDVGGTKTLLRCVEPNGAIVAERRFDSGAFSTFSDLLRQFIAACPGPVSSACFAVAGPVIQRHAEVTNLGWTIRADDLEKSFGIAHVELMNDFYGVALGVPLMGDDDLQCLHQGARDRSAPLGILGAGTGLGEAIITFHGSEWSVVPSEGGHADFAPQDEEQARLFLWLHERYGHVSWERVISGMGLANIYEFVTGREEDPATIAHLAGQGDSSALRTFHIFVDVYGAEAGNMALRVLARGGIFLAGGVAAKNVAFFTDGRFVEAFLRKGRFRDFLTSIPIYLITNQHVGLLGAVEAAQRWNRART
jgi:glucokinase